MFAFEQDGAAVGDTQKAAPSPLYRKVAASTECGLTMVQKMK